MGIFRKLFARESVDANENIFPGILAEISREAVLALNIETLDTIPNKAAAAAAQKSCRVYIEVVFGGFDGDARPIDQIPEIRAWAQAAEEQHPDFSFWLTPGALLRHWLCLGANYAERLPDSSIDIALGSERFVKQAAASAMLAHMRLVTAGMPSDRVLGITAQEPTRSMDAIRSGNVVFGKHYQVAL